jgi:hypothetical protein
MMGMGYMSPQQETPMAPMPGAGDVPTPSTPEQLAAYEAERQKPLEKIRYAIKNNLLSGGATDIRNIAMALSAPGNIPAGALSSGLPFLKENLMGATPSVASGTPGSQKGALDLGLKGRDMIKAQNAAQDAALAAEVQGLPEAARMMKEYRALPAGTPRAVKAHLERLIAEAIGKGVEPGWHPEVTGLAKLLGHEPPAGTNALSALARGALSGLH